MAIFRSLQTNKIPCFWAALIFCAASLPAAPLESGLAASAPGDARLQVLAAAGKYEHTPYRYGGLDRRGVDCSGLVYLSFYDALGVSVPRNTKSLYSWTEKIAMEDAVPGDLVFFKTTGNGTISHVGILVGDGRFIHSASEGPVTGVIYSDLDERYWSRTYAGMGRALPKAAVSVSGNGGMGNKNNKITTKGKSPANLLMGVAVAPTWNIYIPEDGGLIRGAAGQFRVGAEVKPFGLHMIFGAELRPEWDGALGVFRIPLTISWGLSDKLRIFVGPSLSFGDASMNFYGENRQYTGGTAWFGAAGITAAPFNIKIAGNDLSPYGEWAWQSYFNNSERKNIGADVAAGLRFSTGLRFTWRS